MKRDDLGNMTHTQVIHSPCSSSGGSALCVSSGGWFCPRRAAEISQGAAGSPSHQPSAANYPAALLRCVVISLSLCLPLLLH